ncbi:hypothetical protein [Clostridium tyrobutyricum]|jgi:hypothetical protein|uniref:hypothetical protein n=1 Tax=Clostridium tyrobutyricum TaxID=1519 RepID=UPI00057F5040|nr:hypothetical protein [Clostridium tyrobutyricum]
MENLWPKFKLDKLRTPKEILEEQASLLPRLTGDMVYASVDDYKLAPVRVVYGDDPYTSFDFKYQFLIKGKFLDNYSFRPLGVFHNVKIYPLMVKLDGEIVSELEDKKLIQRQDENMDPTIIDVENEDKFIMLLKNIFASEKIIAVIQSIVSMSR